MLLNEEERHKTRDLKAGFAAAVQAQGLGPVGGTEDEYTFKSILDDRVRPGKNAVRMFLVEWEDYAIEAASWEPERHLPEDAVERYFTKKAQAKASPTGSRQRARGSDAMMTSARPPILPFGGLAMGPSTTKPQRPLVANRVAQGTIAELQARWRPYSSERGAGTAPKSHGPMSRDPRTLFISVNLWFLTRELYGSFLFLLHVVYFTFI